jgi:methionyl-tRNA formyltransferase
MTAGLDAGPCLGQQRTPIDPDEDAEQLEARLAEMGAELVLRVLDDVEGGTATSIAQDKTQASKAPRLKKEQGAIDWSRPGQEIKNQVRALRPWPRAFTFWPRAGGHPLRLSIDRVSINPLPSGGGSVRASCDASPGTVLESSKRLLISTGDIPLEILELQSAGKRSMAAGEFLRGNRVNIGEVLGPA